MLISKNTCLLLSILLASSLAFSCKTRKTPIVNNNPAPRGEDATHNPEDIVTKTISFCFDKKDLSSINPTDYKYSISSDASLCSNASDGETYKLKEEGDKILLEEMRLKAPCSYELKIALLKKGDSDTPLKEVKTASTEITIKESTSTDKCYRLIFEGGSGGGSDPKPTQPKSTNLTIKPDIVD